MSTQQEPEFTGWRTYLWPIHNYEIKKFLPTAFIFFCILFNYTVMRDTKDSFVTSASEGTAIIPTLKLFVMGSAVIFVILYAKLSNIFDSEKIFYVITIPFMIFFGLFGFVIDPLREFLHPSPEAIKALHASYPRLINYIDVYAYWAYSLYYILSELWGSVMIGLMFWQYANRITKMKEAKRFYGFFGSIANTALIFSGVTVWFVSKILPTLVSGSSKGLSLKITCSLIVLMCIMMIITYRWMHTNVLTDPQYYDPTEEKKSKKKSKPGLVESAKLLFTSPVLGYIALLVVWYGITINLVEVQWKNQLYLYCKEFADPKGHFDGFMGLHSACIGAFTILFSGLIGSNVLRRFSWFSAAIVTPLLILALGGMFFALIVGRDLPFLSTLATNPVTLATFIGVSAVIISKSIKYALFDPTKEMAYMPLDVELKTKGKAAVDVIGGRGGKGGGAFIQDQLALILGTGKNVLLFAPYTFAIFLAGCGMWILAVKGLNNRVKKAIQDKEKAEEKIQSN